MLVCFVDPRVRKIRNEPEEHSKIASESGLTVVPAARPFAWYLLFISSLSLCFSFLSFFLGWSTTELLYYVGGKQLIQHLAAASELGI